MMLVGLLMVALLGSLPIIAGIALLYKPSEPPGDRSAQSVQPLACGCTAIFFVAVVALFYYAAHNR